MYKLLNIPTMKIMKLAITTSWVFLGLLAATGGAYAQEAAQKARQGTGSASQKPADSYETLLRDAQTLIESGNPGEAYKLLEPFEFEHAGEVRFDYLIGIAALDSGQPDKATLAFERVLAVNPDSAAARLDMARAYYQLGDFPRAKTEFTAALKQNPSATTRANIQKYLDAIDTQKDGKRARFSGYVEAGAGRDSNVNSSTSESRVYVESFATTITLDPVNVKVSDNYYAAAAGGEVNYGLNARWELHAGADLRKHLNRTHTEFDSANTEWHAGVVYETQANWLRVSIIGSQYDLDNTRNSNASGFKGEWRHVFSPRNQLNSLAQSVQYRYVEPYLIPNDIDQQVFGIGWTHVPTDGQFILSGRVHYGTEKDVSPVITVTDPVHGNITANPGGGRNDGAKLFSGIRMSVQMAANENTTLFASAGFQSGNYDKINYRFLRQRKDSLYDLKLSANWHWDKLWTLRPQISYSRNDSNIAIYSYDRMDVLLSVRRDFR